MLVLGGASWSSSRGGGVLFAKERRMSGLVDGLASEFFASYVVVLVVIVVVVVAGVVLRTDVESLSLLFLIPTELSPG